jgi:hypothetical protein
MFMYVFLYYPDCELQCGLLHAAPALDISGNNININGRRPAMTVQIHRAKRMN